MNLDILLCIIAPVGIVYLSKIIGKKFRRRTQILATILLSATLILPVAAVSVDSQLKKAPYITENMEGVYWIETNIGRNESVIFAPDYLSSNLLQLGYLMAVWDFSLSNN
ncbi:MAG: hypothetical protein QW087_06740, partial [Methanomassiliicoccales archaeon]